jgi:2-hydroxychromene-2-carboxylate isomerase
VAPAGFDPFASDRPLIVYIDYKSRYAFVAKDPTTALGRELGIAIDWRPLTPDIPSYLGSARLDARGKVVESPRSPAQWTAVRYSYKDARRYAALSRLELRGTSKIRDTALAGLDMLWAKARGDPVLERQSDPVYERFWKRAFDVEDTAVIEAVLAEAGADVRGFAADARHEALRNPPLTGTPLTGTRQPCLNFLSLALRAELDDTHRRWVAPAATRSDEVTPSRISSKKGT